MTLAADMKICLQNSLHNIDQEISGTEDPKQRELLQVYKSDMENSLEYLNKLL